jgi:hypothetical protein
MMRRIYFSITFFVAATAMAQTPPPASAPAAGYTPPPVSTTYRPLTGKLFFSDAERDRLDKARRDGVQIVDGEVVTRSPRVDGFVRSSSGRTTYWVDGRQRIAADPAKDVSAGASMTGPESTVSFRETQPTAKVAPSNNAPPKKSSKASQTISPAKK